VISAVGEIEVEEAKRKRRQDNRARLKRERTHQEFCIYPVEDGKFSRRTESRIIPELFRAVGGQWRGYGEPEKNRI
jgi:hypothetical protein